MHRAEPSVECFCRVHTFWWWWWWWWWWWVVFLFLFLFMFLFLFLFLFIFLFLFLFLLWRWWWYVVRGGDVGSGCCCRLCCHCRRRSWMVFSIYHEEMNTYTNYTLVQPSWNAWIVTYPKKFGDHFPLGNTAFLSEHIMFSNFLCFKLSKPWLEASKAICTSYPLHPAGGFPRPNGRNHPIGRTAWQTGADWRKNRDFCLRRFEKKTHINWLLRLLDMQDVWGKAKI